MEVTKGDMSSQAYPFSKAIRWAYSWAAHIKGPSTNDGFTLTRNT